MRERQGCLQGLLELFLLNTLFDWMQRRFGLGRGFSCGGCGCGIILLIIFIVLACQIVTGTNWFKVY